MRALGQSGSELRPEGHGTHREDVLMRWCIDLARLREGCTGCSMHEMNPPLGASTGALNAHAHRWVTMGDDMVWMNKRMVVHGSAWSG